MNPLDSILRRRALCIDDSFVCFKNLNCSKREAVTFTIRPMTLTMKVTNDLGEGRALSDETLRKMREKMTQNMIDNIERDTADALAQTSSPGVVTSQRLDPELSAIVKMYSDEVMREHFRGLDRLTEDLVRRKRNGKEDNEKEKD